MHIRFELILELFESRQVEFRQLVLWQPNRHLWLTRDTLDSTCHGASLTHAEFGIPTAASSLIYLLLEDPVEERPVVDRTPPPPVGFSRRTSTVFLSCETFILNTTCPNFTNSQVTENDPARRSRIQLRQNSIV
ncbi:hypothetical protein T10_8110 [Trichinella papuae]|uniref:Uncharacterized protein n=1 Tax=Trichinella papuae TaxID=268474 RepID=A0A0V1N972_9BILA|nr:hypothetical protein T10_8110 [Trichinella papuae]